MDQLRKEQFFKILEKYHTGNASKEEVEFLDAYYQVFGLRADYTSGLEEETRLLLKNDLNSSIRKNISVYQAGKIEAGKKTVYRWSVSAAAAIIIIAGAGLFYYPQKRNPDQEANHIIKNNIPSGGNMAVTTIDIGSGGNKVVPTNDIEPGGNKAVLILANGKKISLTDVNNGTLAEQADVQITKIADGQLVYTILPDRQQIPDTEDQYNTIETPKGGRYRVRLPDGTNVWLNAASKLTYPSSFTGHQTRRVELSGEAYFEVAKDIAHPFMVKTIKQEVEVLGTHFNISSYEDEPAVKTTLLEGSVKVYVPGSPSPLERAGVRLKPGQQSTLTLNNIKIENINTEQRAVAWKNDQFVFESDDIQYIMRMISRWYNVEVEYVGAIPENKFGGAVSRFENVSEVLKSLELTGRVQFKIEGRRILVSK